jgi:hypothetical protein
VTQRVAQGGTVVLTGTYETGTGDLVDPITPTVDIIDADDTELVTNDIPDRVSLGQYTYTYVVPDDGAVGMWRIHWSGVIDGLTSGGDDWFNVVTPGEIITSTYDLLTLDEAKAALNIPLADTTFDTELHAYITAVSQRIDDLCGPGVKRSVADEVHDGGDSLIFPNETPVASIGEVVEYSSGTGTTLTGETNTVAGTYVLEGAGTHLSLVRRRSSWSDAPFVAGRGNVMISYVAGRFDSTADVSPLFKQAAAKTLSWLWRGDQGAGTATFGGVEGTSLFGLGFALPNSVVELLAYERRPPVVA